MHKVGTLLVAVLCILGLSVNAYALATTVANAVIGMDTDDAEVGTDADDVLAACGGAGTFEIVDANADGIPDYAQMALAEELVIDGNAVVIAALNALEAEIDDIGALGGQASIDGFSYWMAIEPDTMDGYADCFDDGAPVVGDLSLALDVARAAAVAGGGDLAEPILAATGNPDGDSRNNLEEWNWVRQGSGKGPAKANATSDADFLADVATFVKAATDATENQDTFPAATGVPVSGGIGLGLLALGIAAGGALIIRRKK